MFAHTGKYCYHALIEQEVLFWASSSGDYDPDDIELLDRMKRGNPKKIPANEYVKPLADVFPKSININLVADEVKGFCNNGYH